MISVVVACRNERKHIVPFLNSVAQQDDPGLDWELIIADGMSNDGTREILRSHLTDHPKVRLIDNPGKIVSTGLNQAIRAANGDIIIRMDAHTEYARDYVSQCVRLLEATGADNIGGPPRTKADGFLARAVAVAYYSPFASGGAKFHDVNYEGYIDTVAYGCWHKTTLERAGLFDESLVRNQDDELNLRLIRAGGKIWQSPSIVSWYSPRPTLTGLFGQYFQYGFWKVRVVRKHRVVASWRHLVPGAFVLANLAFLLTSMMGGIVGDGRLMTYSAVLWALMIVTYLSMAFAFSLSAAKLHGWRLLPVLPIVFTVYHISYGTGFLSGLIYWALPGAGSRKIGRLFTDITR